MENTAFRVYCSTYMLFDVTLPNALRQSHAHESDHLQSLFQYPTWSFYITITGYLENRSRMETSGGSVKKCLLYCGYGI